MLQLQENELFLLFILIVANKMYARAQMQNTNNFNVAEFVNGQNFSQNFH